MILVFLQAKRQRKKGPATPLRWNAVESREGVHLPGGIFSSSGSFGPVVEKSPIEEKQAMAVIWQIPIAGRNNSWNAAVRLFDAMVKLTILYVSGLWALGHMHEIEEIQLLFLKRFLQVPGCMPGYVLRLETGMVALASEIVKRALNYYIKLESMKAGRYPKIMLEKLKALDDTPPATSSRIRTWTAQLISKDYPVRDQLGTL